jgi:RimJ/RimL family protein N-acetyltransferase
MKPQRVFLQELTEAHLPEVQALANDPDIARFTGFPAPAPDDFAVQWYARYVAGRLDGTRALFVALGDDGRFLGVALAFNINAEEREMELGYLVAPAERGWGAGAELLRHLAAWAFGPGNALRVTLIIDVANVASSRVAARAGFVREGIMRSTYFKQGMRTDVELWSRLPSDPTPAV